MNLKHFRGNPALPSWSLLATVLAVGLFVMPTSAQATLVSLYSYSGTLDTVVDSGTGTLAGTGAGASFSGTFMYGVTNADIDVTEPAVSGTETSYGFVFHSSAVTVGGTSEASVNTFLDIADNLLPTAEEVNLVNALFGTSVPVGQPVDIWGLSADSPDAMFDPVTDELAAGITWDVSLLDFSSTLYGNQAFRAVPPVTGLVDGGLFFIEEAINGVIVFSAIGSVNMTTQSYQTAEVTLVPVPAAAWLFASALGWLGWIRRKAA